MQFQYAENITMAITAQALRQSGNTNVLVSQMFSFALNGYSSAYKIGRYY